MSKSKWVNRNISAGSSQTPSPDAVRYRREYGYKRSSRPFLMGDRQSRSRSRSRRQRMANRFSGFAIFIVCVVTVVFVTRFLKSNGAKPKSAPAAPATEQTSSARAGKDPLTRNPEQTVRGFLSARTIPELTNFGRLDDNSASLIRQFGTEIIDWNKNQGERTGLQPAKANGLTFSAFQIDHTTEPARYVYVVQTPFGPRVDIGAFLGWSSVPWNDLSSGKETQATIVRALVSRDSTYNSRFTDEATWQSFRLASPDGSASIHGYARRDTNTNLALNRLLPQEKSPAFPVIVSLDEGQAGSSDGQFRIARVLAAGWAMGFEILEDNLPKLDEKTLFKSIPIPGEVAPAKN